MKTADLIGPALDWTVAKCEGYKPCYTNGRLRPVFRTGLDVESTWPSYSTDWSQGGPIIEREGISVIRLDDQSVPDAKGFWQSKYEPAWGAVIGERHSTSENHGSQGDYWGLSYHVDESAVVGPTYLIAAMRCYVASKLGDEVDIPKELL